MKGAGSEASKPLSTGYTPIPAILRFGCLGGLDAFDSLCCHSKHNDGKKGNKVNTPENRAPTRTTAFSVTRNELIVATIRTQRRTPTVQKRNRSSYFSFSSASPSFNHPPS